MAEMTLAHKIRLYPTEEQAHYFRNAAGCARFVWNWALAEWNRQYEAGERPSAFGLKKQFNGVKKEEFPWTGEVHSQAQIQPFLDLQTAWQNYFRYLRKKAQGIPAPEVGPPNFKGRGAHRAFYVANTELRFDGAQVYIPRVGWIRMAEALRFEGKVMGARVSETAGRWYIAVQVQGAFARKRTGEGEAGVDVGVRRHIILDDGRMQEPLRPLERSLRRLKIRQRRVDRKHRGSSNRRKAKAQVAGLHAQIANQRKHALHQLTTCLVRENKALWVETLGVKDMLQEKRISRALSDVALAELLRQVRYKAILYGTQVTEVERYYPSTKTCSACGHIKHDLTLTHVRWTCPNCQTEHDIDVNAAKNLKNWAPDVDSESGGDVE